MWHLYNKECLILFNQEKKVVESIVFLSWDKYACNLMKEKNFLFLGSVQLYIFAKMQCAVEERAALSPS